MYKIDELIIKLPKEEAEKFIKDVNDLIEEYADNNNLCSQCLTKLEENSYVEYRGECHGFESYETMYEYYCPVCGE